MAAATTLTIEALCAQVHERTVQPKLRRKELISQFQLELGAQGVLSDDLVQKLEEDPATLRQIGRHYDLSGVSNVTQLIRGYPGYTYNPYFAQEEDSTDDDDDCIEWITEVKGAAKYDHLDQLDYLFKLALRKGSKDEDTLYRPLVVVAACFRYRHNHLARNYLAAILLTYPDRRSQLESYLRGRAPRQLIKSHNWEMLREVQQGLGALNPIPLNPGMGESYLMGRNATPAILQEFFPEGPLPQLLHRGVIEADNLELAVYLDTLEPSDGKEVRTIYLIRDAIFVGALRILDHYLTPELNLGLWDIFCPPEEKRGDEDRPDLFRLIEKRGDEDRPDLFRLIEKRGDEDRPDLFRLIEKGKKEILTLVLARIKI